MPYPPNGEAQTDRSTAMPHRIDQQEAQKDHADRAQNASVSWQRGRLPRWSRPRGPIQIAMSTMAMARSAAPWTSPSQIDTLAFATNSGAHDWRGAGVFCCMMRVSATCADTHNRHLTLTRHYLSFFYISELYYAVFVDSVVSGCSDGFRYAYLCLLFRGIRKQRSPLS